MPRPKLEEIQRVIHEKANRRVVAAHTAGAVAATEHRLGDLYRGPWVEADRYKILDPRERAAFVEGYLAALPRLRCDDKGRIIELGPSR
jgi:hypothetical protein